MQKVAYTRCFTFQVYNQNDVFPLLANLKHLELTVLPEYDWTIHLITCFLKASPYLQRLRLKVYISSYSVE